MKITNVEIDVHNCKKIEDKKTGYEGLCPLIRVSFVDDVGKRKPITYNGYIVAMNYQRGNPAANGRWHFMYQNIRTKKTYSIYCSKDELNLTPEDYYALLTGKFEEKKSAGSELAEKLIKLCF